MCSSALADSKARVWRRIEGLFFFLTHGKVRGRCWGCADPSVLHTTRGPQNAATLWPRKCLNLALTRCACHHIWCVGPW